MKKFARLALHTFLWFLCLGGAAHAGPLAAAIVAFANFLGSGTIFANIVNLAVTAALKVGVGLLQRAIQGKQRQPGIKAEVQVGGDNPLSFIVGNYATSGQLEYVNTFGKNSGDTPNAGLAYVISLSDIPVTGFSSTVWVNGEKCTISDDLDPDGFGYGVNEFKRGSKYYLWVKFYDGTQVAADPYLMAKFGADPDRPYTSDMIGRGVAYAVVTARFRRQFFNGIPQFRFEVQGIKLYNPAKDSTNGGSGLHRWDDPATWEFSANNAVINYNITRGIYHDGQWIYGGQNLPALLLPSSSWIAAINECDVDIPLLGGGTEKQYRAGYEINCDQEPLDVIELFLDGCSGRMVEVGGYYKINVGPPPAAVYAFTDADIVATSDLTLDPFPGMEATYNGAHASYPEPLEGWSIKDAPPYLNAAYEAADEGRRLLASLNLSATPFNTQVQRLIKAAVEANRRFRRHIVPLPPEAWLLEPGDVVSWSSTREGYASKNFVISSMTGKPGFIQIVSLQEVDATDYNWTPATDQKPYSIGYVGSLLPAPQLVVGWAVAPGTFYDSSAAARRPSINVTFSADQDDVRAVRVMVRLAASGAIVFDAEIPYGEIDPLITSRTVTLNGTFLPNTLYEVSGEFLPFTGRETEPTAWLSVLTLNILLGDDDVYLPGMIADLEEFISENVEAIDVRSLIDKQKQIALKALDQDAANYGDKIYVLNEIVSRYNLVTAEYQSSILVATGPNSAIVARLDILEATIPSLATVAALNSLSVTVDAQGDDITANADAITILEATIPDLATVAALNSLSATVSSQGGQITANADAISGLTATVGNFSADALFRVSVLATEAGALSTIGLTVAATGGGPSSTASLILSALAGGLSRVGVIADQFFIKSGANSEKPFIFQDGVATLNVLNCGTIVAGIIADNITPASRKFVLTPNAGSIEWFE